MYYVCVMANIRSITDDIEANLWSNTGQHIPDDGVCWNGEPKSRTNKRPCARPQSVSQSGGRIMANLILSLYMIDIFYTLFILIGHP
jgi:hypothetical protein